MNKFLQAKGISCFWSPFYLGNYRNCLSHTRFQHNQLLTRSNNLVATPCAVVSDEFTASKSTIHDNYRRICMYEPLRRVYCMPLGNATNDNWPRKELSELVRECACATFVPLKLWQNNWKIYHLKCTQVNAYGRALQCDICSTYICIFQNNGMWNMNHVPTANSLCHLNDLCH